MLKQRILTAAILIPLALLWLLLPITYFTAILTLITAYAGWEWCNLMELTSKKWRAFYVFFICLTIFLAALAPITSLLIGLIGWLTVIFLVVSYERGGHEYLRTTSWLGFTGLWVLVPCWMGIVITKSLPQGTLWLLLLLLIVWSVDIGAYFVGRLYGKRHLAIRVSPGKTLEGLAGGLGLALVVSTISVWLMGLSVNSWLAWVLLVVLTTLFSVLGDLFESLLKRQCGIKDSGNVLPGHGGILDRIDSLTAAAPIFALGLLLVGYVT